MLLSAAVGFLAGLVVCGTVVGLLLPGLIRAQSAKTVRLYHDFLRPPHGPTVILLERPSRDARPPERADVTRPARRVDSPRPLPPASTAAHAGQPGGESTILQQIYEQNLQLHQQLAQQSTASPADPDVSARVS